MNKSTGTCDFEELCDQIADRSTASRGDVQVVVDGLLYILKPNASRKGRPSSWAISGHFQAVIGSKGTKLEADFNASLIKRPRIVFRPSVTLKSVTGLAKFEEDRARRTCPGRRRQRIPLTKSSGLRAPLDEKRCTPADGAIRSVGGDAIRTPPAAPSTFR